MTEQQLQEINEGWAEWQECYYNPHKDEEIEQMFKDMEQASGTTEQ